jgi:hypothetical protein
MQFLFRGAMCVGALMVGVLLPAAAATVSGSVSFSGGVLGSWSIGFASDSPTLELKQAAIQLPAGFGFDTQLGGFGYLAAQDFAKTGGGATASLTPATTAARDGATLLILDFTGFTASSGPFLFNLDVDGTAVLQPLQNCGVYPALSAQRIACNIQNGIAIVANGIAVTNASLVNGGEIAGTQAALSFGWSDPVPPQLVATLSNLGGNNARGDFRGVVTPEPSAAALAAAGLAALLLLKRRK